MSCWGDQKIVSSGGFLSREAKTSKIKVSKRAERVGTATIDEQNNFGKMEISIFSIENLDSHDFRGSKPLGSRLEAPGTISYGCDGRETAKMKLPEAERVGTAAIDAGNNFGKMDFLIFRSKILTFMILEGPGLSGRRILNTI